MKRIITATIFLLFVSSIYANDSIKIIELKKSLSNLENKVTALSNQSPDKVVEEYRFTNDRINNQLSFIGVIATIFGVIIALGTIYIGFESIKYSREKKNTLKTLEEAKAFVDEKKNEFDALLKEKYNEFNNEYSKLIRLAHEQLIESIDAETSRLKEFANLKTKEIEHITIERKPDELIETFSKRFEFFESIGIPDDPKILLSKAKLLSEKKMHNEAIKLAEKLIKIEPENASGYWRLGWDYSELNKHDDAILNYKMAIKFNENDSSAHNNLAVQYENKELYYDALKEYDIAISLLPGNSLYHRNRGRVLFLLKSNEEAISSYRKAIEISPKEEYIYEQIIKKLKELKRYTEVEEFYDLSIKNIPEKSSELNFNKAEFFASIKQYDKAKLIYKILIENNYKTEDCRVKISLINYYEKDYESAVSNIEEAILFNTQNEDLYVFKIVYLIKLDINKAKDYANQTLETFNNENYHFKVARQFSKEKEIGFAKDVYNKALILIEGQLVKNEPRDISNYIECLISTEQYSKANDFYIEKKDSIEDPKYRNLIDFLIIIKDIVVSKKNLTEFNLTNLREYYSIEKNYATWNFEDILGMIEDRLEKSTYKTIVDFTEFMKGKKNINEIDGII